MNDDCFKDELGTDIEDNWIKIAVEENVIYFELFLKTDKYFEK